MKDRSYAGKLYQWQSMIENIQESLPSIPEADVPFADAQQKVAEFRATQEAIQMIEGQRKELIERRRHLDQETRRSIRRLASVARGHMGFGNPALEKFGVRSEDWSRRKRKAPEKAKAAPKG
ncbi:MAG TPA: hypothetical protein VN851_00345 [Thermoanaerobaculia bacterium]|nr:hypothetical protein [Thermoanaerobaculia bacterium]